MKKTKFLFLFIFIVSIITVSVFADDSQITVKIDGKEIQFDVQPLIKDGSTLVPVRAIFESLNATVEWDDINRTVISTKGNTTIKIPIDSKTMYVNDKEISLYMPATIIGGRTLVPLRAISEAYGCQVGWDGKVKLVSIINDSSNYTMLYAPDNRSRAVKNGEVNSHLKVGWYRDVELKDNTLHYTDEEMYKQFVDFVVENGSLSEGKYGIQTSLPYHSSDKGTTYGTITLVYDPSQKNLELQVFEVYESASRNATTFQFLTIDLPKKSDKYNWQFQYMIDDESYKNNDYFMASEGTINANAESYLSGNSIKTTNIIYGREIVDGSSASNVGILTIWISAYGNNMFTENNSSLNFDFFGIK